MNSDNNQAIENFRKYLRIRSVQPNPDYDGCIKLIQELAIDLDLSINIMEFEPGKPIALLTWPGLEPHLPSILLNGHMDVVPVDETKWTHDPFAAEMDEEGNIFGRGAQDMKCISIQYLEAIRRLKKKAIRLKRTVHVSFVPDEEIHSEHGMKLFVQSDIFKSLNVGFALDEGCAYRNYLLIFYGERVLCHLEVHCTGTSGHGAILYSDTAAEKANKILSRFLEYRQKNVQLMNQLYIRSGECTSVNLTKIQGGIQKNVLPPEIVLTFDCRIHPRDNDTFLMEVEQWCKESGNGVTYKIIQHDQLIPCTKIDDTNPYWVALKGVLEKTKYEMLTLLCPGTTDARFFRQLGIPTFGFSPLVETKFRLHSHDEYLSASAFLYGIDLFEQIIPAVANAKII